MTSVGSVRRIVAALTALMTMAVVARAEEVNQADINATRDWIRNSDPNLQQIDQRADAESR